MDRNDRPSQCPETEESLRPASFGQRRLWFLDRMRPGEYNYNITWLLDVSGPLQPAALARALVAVAARQAVLRTTFATVDGEPMQRVARRPRIRLPLVDLSALPPRRRSAEAERLAVDDERRPFDLEAGPLLRTTLIRLDPRGHRPRRHRLQTAFHHTISDGWSLNLYTAELEAFYATFATGAERADLAPLAFDYGDWAERQWDEADGGAAADDVEYWRGALDGASGRIDLSTDRPRPAEPGLRAGWVPLRVPSEVTDRLAALGRDAGHGLFAVVSAGIQALLYRSSGTEDLLTGFPIRRRETAAERSLLGFFVKMLPLRTRVDGTIPFSELVERVGRGVREAVAHRRAPFHRILEAVHPDRTTSQVSLFDVVAVLQGRPLPETRLPGGAVVRQRLLEHEGAKFDLTINLTPGRKDREGDGAGGLYGEIEYRRELFDATTVERLARSFETLLAGAVAAPATVVGELPVLTPAERQAVTVEWTAEPFAAQGRVELPEGGERFDRLLEARARRHPDAVALEGPERTLTYAGLVRAADELARRLLDAGVTPDEPVGLHAARSVEAVVAMLGISRAGAAHLPLDPEYPEERLLFMLADAGVRTVVTTPERAAFLPDGVVAVPMAARLPESDPPAGPSPGPRTVDGRGLAYLIYTSGSTGRPKGVEIEHRTLCRFARSWGRAVAIGPASRTLQVSSLNFDASVLEVFPTLAAGGTLVVGSAGHPAPGEPLARWMAARRVTHTLLVPSVLAALPEEPPLPDLRSLAVGGEACSAELARAWLERLAETGGRLFDAYGPTEVTVVATVGPVDRGLGPGGRPSIGRPLDPARLRVLDAAGRPVAIGVAGELCVGGPGLARGYRGRPGLTAERFRPDPSAGSSDPATAGGRLYRTGDLARWLPDGRLDFLGRIDRQVKVRGFRIEPGEIEALLGRSPGVAEAAVAVHRPEGRPASLVALCVPRSEDSGEPTPEAGALRAFLGERLPDHMVPSFYLFPEALPRTPNGKLDRRALDRLAAESGVAAPRTTAPPRTPTERLLAGLWAEALGIAAAGVGAGDHFFELGGHSLAATRVVSRARSAFGVELPLRALFEDPVLDRLAERIDALRRQEEEGPTETRDQPVRPLPDAGGARVAPPSFGQERLWLLDRLLPDTGLYNVPILVQLPDGRAGSPGAVSRALGALVRRHEALRTTLSERDEQPVQVVAPPPEGGLALPVADLGGLPAGRVEREAERLVAREARRPFDLARGPVLRPLLLRGRERAPDGADRLLLVIHHGFFDGWSLGILARELGELCRAGAEGRAPDLDPLPVQYADYAVWQRQRLAGPLLEAHLAWWRRRLEGAPDTLELPYDRRPGRERGPKRGGGRGGAPAADGRACPLEPRVAAGVDELARTAAATPFMVLLAAFTAVLGRVTGACDVVVGSPDAGRDRPEIEGLIGFFVNTLPLRVGLGGRPRFRELVERARETALGAFAHHELPFERLVEELAPPRDGHDALRNPLFQVLFALHEDRGGGEPAAGADGEPGRGLGPVARALGNGSAKFDLTLTVKRSVSGPDGEADLAAVLEWNADRFDATTGGRLLGHVVRLLEVAVADPELRLDELPLLTAAERHQVAVEWSTGATSGPAPEVEKCSLGELFAGRAAATPDAVAVVDGGRHVTYGALERRSAALAARLRELGVGVDTPVGLAVERSAELVVGVLGIVRAGGGYVPLDASYPEERLAFVLEDLELPVLVADAEGAERVPRPGTRPGDGPGRPGTSPGPTTVVLSREPPGLVPGRPDPPPGLVPGHSDEPPGPAPAPDALAYVVYTSGSTGRPKGVTVPHRAVVRLVRGSAFAHFGPEETFLQLAPVAFDASTLELWGPLLHGGRLVLAPPGPLAVEELAARVAAERVTTLWLTAGLFHQVAEAALEDLAGVRQLLAGGDVLAPEVCRRVLAELTGTRLINGYGPTENTTFTCCHPIGAGDPAGAIPIGRPVARTSVYAVDRNLRLQPAGVPGELVTGGAGVARGYAGRPALTAERFVPDPFAGPGSPGARLYRTGDRVRVRPDGVVEFLGRLDRQVKVRGFRIEPGEIEAALTAHPAVAEAAVVARSAGAEGAAGDERLVAYVVSAGEAPAADPVDSLRDHLATRLPGHMVPSAFVLLDELPLGPTGKVDRRALPEPDPTPSAGSEGIGRAPRTPVEEVLVGLWAELLGLDQASLGVGDDFFDRGGHSLLATRLVSQLRTVLGVELPLARVFEAPTVAGLAVAVEEALADPAAPVSEPIEPVPRSGRPDERFPASFDQERLWLLDRMAPDDPSYVVPTPLRLRGSLDRPALGRALRALIERHEVLRTTYPEVDGAPVQHIHRSGPAAELPLPVVDLSALPESVRSVESVALATADAGTPFDLGRGPVARAALLVLGPEDHLLLLSVHHVATDGWSVGVMLRDLEAAYTDPSGGRPPLPVQYADYAVWQRRRLRGEALEARLAWWRERLEGRSVVEMPTDRPRPAVPGRWGGSVERPVTPAALERLRSLARREGATLFMVFLAGFDAVLARLTGHDDLVIGSPTANRPRREVEELIGFFVNTLAIRTDLGGDPSFAEVLARTRESALAAYTHGDLPFDRLVEDLAPNRAAGINPLFQVVFAHRAGPAAAGGGRWDGLEVEPVRVHNRTAKFDLTIQAVETADRTVLHAEYRTELFDAATVSRLLRRVETLLDAAARSPELRLGELPLMPPSEHHQVLVEWGRGAGGSRAEQGRARGLEQPLGERFAERARATPDAVAVVDGGRHVSYGALERRSAALAGRLRELGVGVDTPVGLAVERSAELIVGVLGIVRAGGGYVPLDASYPEERLAFVLEDLELPVLVADAAGTQRAPRLPCVGPGLVPGRPDEPPGLVPGHSDEPPGLAPGPSDRPPGLVPGLRNQPSALGPDALAYVVYTSGSTGRPKGVAVPHRAVSRLVLGSSFARFGPDETFLQLAPVAFDASTLEIWGPLLHGGRLVVAPPGREALDRLSALVAAERVTTLWLTAGLFHQVARQDLAPFAGVRRLLAGGDVLAPEACRRVLTALPRTELVDGYGPTENTTFTSCHRMGAPHEVDDPVPIGRPVDHTTVHVVDRSLRPLPPGVPGELVAGGAGLARGYAGRPARTAESFVPDPFAGIAGGAAPGARLYRTGDLARFRPDGRLELFGRLDRQVKIRGFRVEPGEIENALAEHPAVAEAVVVLRRPQGDRAAAGDERLVAYVVPSGRDGDAEELTARLREHLGARLPALMVPGIFVPLDALPLGPTGKLDRAALPAPEPPEDAGRAAPRSAVETKLAGLWAELLGIGAERVGVDDEFFALGGHSLLAYQLVGRIRERFGVDLGLARVFETPTLAGLAAVIEQEVLAARLAARGRRRRGGGSGSKSDSGRPGPRRVPRRRRRLVARGSAAAPSPEPSSAGRSAERTGSADPVPGQASELAPVPREGAPLPLSYGQERLWFLERLTPGGASYTVPTPLQLSGALDRPALAEALGALVARHEVLRTTYPEVDGAPVQRIRPPAAVRSAEVPLPLVDLSGLPGTVRRGEAERVVAADARRPFDLERGPVVRAALLVLAPRDHLLALDVHHIATDGWSLGVLLRDLQSAYEAARGDGRPSADRHGGELPPLSIQYADYAAWERARFARSGGDGEGRLESGMAWWRERLAGADGPPPVLGLPTDRPRPAVESPRGAVLTRRLAPETARRLTALGRRERATPFMLLLAGFDVLLARVTGQSDLAVGTLVAGRSRRELEDLIGFFVNTVVIRADLSGDPSFAEVLGRVRGVALDAFEHADVPFGKVVEELSPERSLAGTPFFQVLLAHLSGSVHRGVRRWEGVEVELLPVGNDAAKFDLSLHGADRDGGLEVTAEYRTELFDAATVARLLGHLETLLAAAADEPSRRLGELPLLDRAARHQILVEQADGPALPDRSEPACIHELVAAQAARTPEAEALVAAGARWSYATLRQRASAVAHRLAAALGDRLRPEARVAVCAARSADLVAGLLGVLEAGCAYVPLDPAYPRERLELMLEDSSAVAILADGANRGLAETLARAPAADRPAVVPLGAGGAVGDAPGVCPLPGHLAYLIYTSGSTGRPKAVAIEHRAVAALIGWAAEAFSAEELRGVAAVTSISFDLSVFELFVPLALGGRVILADDALALPRAEGADEVVLLDTVPSSAAELARARTVPAGVRTVNLAGEPLRRDLVERLLALPGVGRVLNLYGPSEDTTYSTWEVVSDGRAGDPAGAEPREPTIGRPVSGTRAYVADPALRPVPPGVPGELLLGGAGLARGYLGRPAATAERWVPDPFVRWTDAPGARLYRTGDLVRRLPDGRLDFLGRLDHQVKIRGFRIELGEIEAALAAQPEVAEAAVRAWEGPAGPALAAYVAPAAGRSGTGLARLPADLPTERLTERLEAVLAERLPAVMVPSDWVVLEALPHTPSGKIDRKALPEPERRVDPGGDGAPKAPRTPLEELLVARFEELLGLDRVGVDDDFFRLGGHSLLAARLVARLRDLLDVEVPLRRVFEDSTPAALARAVEEARTRSPAPPIERRSRPAGEIEPPLPLSPGQERLWFLNRLEPGDPTFNLPLALRLTGRVDRPVLAAVLGELVRRHEALRTRFVEMAGRPGQVVEPPRPVPLPVVDCTGLPAARRGGEVRRTLADWARRPFDLDGGPLRRAVLIAGAPDGVGSADEHVLVLSTHHIVADGVSLDLLREEIAVLYDALGAGQTAELPEPPIQPADHALWQRRRLESGETEERLGFWRRALADPPAPLELPADRSRSAGGRSGGRRGDVVSLRLADETAAALRSLSRTEGATLFMTLLAGVEALLQGITGREDFLLGTPVGHRERPELAGVVGFFVDTLPLRADLSGDPPFRELLARVRRTALDAYGHADVPFDRLVALLEDLAPGRTERAASANPLFRVMVALRQGAGDDEAPRPAGDLAIRLVDLHTGTSQFDLTVYADATPERLALALEYDLDLFEPATAERLLQNAEQLLEAAAESPEAPVSTLLERVRVHAGGPLVGPGRDRAAAPSPPPAPAAPAPDDPASRAAARRVRIASRRSRLTPEQRAALDRRLRKASDRISGRPDEESCLVSIDPAGGRPPLFLVHPAGGDVLCFRQLARHLDPDLPVYGLQSRGLAGDGTPRTTIESMARGYLEEVRRVQPEGPCRLGGWSLGGVVAFEMARALEAVGEAVELLAILDTVPRLADLLGELADPERAAALLADDGRWLADVAEYVRGVWGKDLGLGLEELRALGPEERLERFLAALDRAGLVPAGAGVGHLRRLLDVFKTNCRAAAVYRPGRYGGPITLFRAAGSDDAEGRVTPAGPAEDTAAVSPDAAAAMARFRDDPTLGWSAYSDRPVAVVTVPGTHVSLLGEPHVATLAARLDERLGAIPIPADSSAGPHREPPEEE